MSILARRYGSASTSRSSSAIDMADHFVM